MILDCEWGKWEDWLKCTASCGGGVQVRTRRTIPYNEPWECIGSFIDQQSCNIKPCPEVETLQKDVIYLQRESMFKSLFIIVFQSQIIFILEGVHFYHYHISDNGLAARMSSIDVAVLRNSAVAEENRKRHTNADSAFQTICTFMDLIYGQQLDDKNLKSCCYVIHKKTQIGHFLTCITNKQNNIANFFDKKTVGKCDDTTTSCGGLAVE